MRNSSKLGYMALSFCARTAFTGDSIHAYLSIAQTTLKSELQGTNHLIASDFTPYIRILLAGIRNLGQCPCPHCRTPLDSVHQVGMLKDMAMRVNSVRVDDAQRKGLVVSARRVIYQKGFTVNSAAVDNLLKDLSLVLNKVCMGNVLFYYGFSYP